MVVTVIAESGAKISSYREYNFDDPYKLLSTSLAAHHTLASLQRIMTDPKYVKRQVRKEARLQDLRGPFIDCIIAATRTKAERQAIIAEMDKVGCYLYRQLDLPRLRRELDTFCRDSGVELLSPTPPQDIMGL